MTFECLKSTKSLVCPILRCSIELDYSFYFHIIWYFFLALVRGSFLSIHFLLGSNGGRASPNLALGQSLFVQIGSFLSLAKVGLSSSELGQVHGSDLFSFLNLLLVGLDLALELIKKGLHPLMVLAVLVGSISHFLDSPLSPPQILLGVGKAPALGFKLRFQLPDPSIHPRHSLL